MLYWTLKVYVFLDKPFPQYIQSDVLEQRLQTEVTA
jgi:hypothetical protein